MVPPRLLMILTENHTMLPERDMRGLVRLAQVAEETGFDAVMISEQTMLGGDAACNGLMENPRMYAAIGNQDPATPWPSSVATLAAVAMATERVRVVAGAIIPPLRHPILLAKDLATIDLLCEGRLVVQPTVSWQRAEYAAHGIPFERRGRILDEHLAAMRAIWAASPAAFEGEYFTFTDVWSEPKAWRPEGPRMWFGGERMHAALVRRLSAYGHGFHPFGAPTDDDLAMLAEGLGAVGRSLDEIELIGGTRATFDGPDSVADVDAAFADVERQIERGYSTFCMKPSQYTDDVGEVREICHRMVELVSGYDVSACPGVTAP
jgi:alkanesulfonate monooxygenase SsuD/methylene tetrahydromethanopterin reductase-like flavin-dependent oxidoreductase (luciferase family)